MLDGLSPEFLALLARLWTRRTESLPDGSLLRRDFEEESAQCWDSVISIESATNLHECSGIGVLTIQEIFSGRIFVFSVGVSVVVIAVVLGFFAADCHDQREVHYLLSDFNWYSPPGWLCFWCRGEGARHAVLGDVMFSY